MPTRPVSIETLRLIAAVRDALAEHLGADATVDERPLFGCHAFMVNGKLCLAERPGVRELDPRGGMPGYFWVEPVGYTTKAQWRHWITAALAYNPQAKASPRRARARAAPTTAPHEQAQKT